MRTLQRWLGNRWAGLTVVVLIGALLRFASLSDVPNGYFHDEAWSAMKAAAIAGGAAPPQLYFPENNGMDALPVYLIALMFQLTGPLAIGSRIISSLAGSLTILAAYGSAWELLAGERHRHGLSLIAAFVVATLFWALTTSRTGWHAASMTLVVTLCLAALFRGRRLKRLRWFIIAGLLAGLAQYTYPSARFLPVLIVLIGAIDTSTSRTHRRAVVVHFALLFTAAAIVFAPLGLYFLRNPEWFFVRAQQTAESGATDLGQNVIKTLAGLSIYGDSEGLHNLPGRPALDPILSVFFVAGLIICLSKRRPVHWVLIAWILVFSLPVILTGQAPLFRRWTGILPAEAILVAMGAIAIMQFLCDRLAIRILGPTLIAVSLIASAGASITTYFGPYATNPYMFWAYDSGMTQVANYIRSQPDTAIFLTPYDRFYEVVAITLAETGRSPIQSYNGNACAVFPETTTRRTEWVVITEKDDHTLPLMQRIFPAGQFVWQIASPAGVYARAFRVPPQRAAQLVLEQRRQADLGGKLHLIGFELPHRIASGGILRVTIALKDVALLGRPYKVFLHLRSADGAVLAQADRVPCNFTLNEADWRPGDIVLESYDVPIPAETPPGQYRLVLGLYQPDSGARLAVTGSELDHDADSVVLGTVEVMTNEP